MRVSFSDRRKTIFLEAIISEASNFRSDRDSLFDIVGLSMRLDIVGKVQ
jgi:hypothetical protein